MAIVRVIKICLRLIIFVILLSYLTTFWMQWKEVLYKNKSVTKNLPSSKLLFKNDLEEAYRYLNFCPNVSRPIKDNIQWRNKRWQFFVNGVREVYILDGYYDDRGDAPLIRVFPIAVVPEGMEPADDTLFALLWYDDMKYPVSVTSVCNSNHTTSFWHINKSQYGILYHEIELQRKDKLPTHFSLMHAPCVSPKTFLSLVVPEKLEKPSQEIGLCVKAIWGNYTSENAPYFVNWMESLKLFGLKKVYMYTSGLNLQDDVIRNVFNHYVTSGFLSTEFLSNNLYETDTVYMDKHISQALVLTVVNDCLYRNMHKYQFLLHHDTDEILVPRNNLTYRQVLDSFFAKDERYRDFESLLVRSAFFYTFYEPSHSAYPAYMIFLRYAYRQPFEVPGVTWHRGNGVMKAFQNARTCAVMNIHGCKRTVKGEGKRPKGYGHTFLPTDQILSHHYRDTCKLKGRCETEASRRLVDTTVHDTIGAELQDNVRNVLTSVGYFKNIKNHG